MTIFKQCKMYTRFHYQIWLWVKYQIQEDQFLGRHVGSLISWYNSPNLEFMLCIFEPSYDVFSLLHQRFDSTLKSLRTTVKKELFAKIV